MATFVDKINELFSRHVDKQIEFILISYNVDVINTIIDIVLTISNCVKITLLDSLL